MRKFFSLVAFLVTLLSLKPASAFIQDGTNKGSGSAATINVSLPAGVKDGDLVGVWLARASQATITTIPSGYTAPTCLSSSNPLNFNTTSNSLTLFTHVWHTGDPTSSLTFSWTGSATILWFSAAWAGASGIDLCKGQGGTSSATVTAPDVGTPSAPNEEAVLFYLSLQSSGTVSSTSTPTTGGTTTVQHSLAAQTSGTPSGAMYELSLGPGAATDLGSTTATFGASAAAFAGMQVLLSSATIPATNYPRGSTKVNASGLAYYNQVDLAPIAGATAWQSPLVDIIAISRSWFAIETACDTFDWDSLDNAILEARLFGKRVSIVINPLGTTPPQSGSHNWIFGSSTCTNSAQVDNVAEEWNQTITGGPAKCTLFYVSDPRDANWQAAVDRFIGQFATRYSGLFGKGQPIVSMKTPGYAGLGTVEQSYYNSAENASLNSGACNQTYYANGNAGVDTANFYGTTTHEDFGSLNKTPGAMTTASMAAVVAHFDATILADVSAPIQIIHPQVTTPNLPQVTALLQGGGDGTINSFFPDVLAHDRSTYPHQQIFEMYGGLACSSTGLGGNPGCFDGVHGQFGFLPANDSQVGLNFQTASQMTGVACVGAGVLFTPSATDCNAPALSIALQDGATYYEAYPNDIASANTYVQSLLQYFSDFANGRLGSRF